MVPIVDLSSIPQKVVNVLAGKALDLDLPIVGRPPPVCSWYFAGTKMKGSERVKVKSTGKFSKLTVSDTNIDDSGDYTLEVKNITGVTTEVIKVVVLCKNNFESPSVWIEFHGPHRRWKLKCNMFLFVSPAKPDEPKGPIRLDEVDATSVTCSWDPPERDGGSPVSGYMVEQRDAHRPGWVPVCDSVSRPTFKFDKLIEGNEYVFRAAAVNRYGMGEFLQSDVVMCKSLNSKEDPHNTLITTALTV